MLPLWIIDITGKSDRRDAFVRLVGQIDNVNISEIFLSNAQQDDEVVLGVPSDKSSDVVQVNDSVSDKTQDIECCDETLDVLEKDVEKSLLEELDEEDKQEAEKKAHIKGDYWYYSQIDVSIIKDALSGRFEDGLNEVLKQHNEEQETVAEKSLNDIDIETYTQAMKMYRFQESMVSEAVKFIHQLRESNAKPYQPINILVLGDATEDFTQTVFASVASLLRKEKGRFLPAHIHQGMCVYGALYIPCDINTFKVDDRKRILHLLDEIEVQRNLTSSLGYDHMMLYQNVQNRTECTYQLLSNEQQAEYLFQCVVHLFYACDINHPLISGTSSEDTFYFSMGAASIYFDMESEDKCDVDKVVFDLVENFKIDGDNEDTVSVKSLVDEDLYRAELFVRDMNFDAIDIDAEDSISFSPHPIVNYYHRHLKKLYYNYALKFFPAALLRKILSKIEDATSTLLDDISTKSIKAYKAAAMSVLPSITKRLSKVNENDGALCHVESLLKKMQELLSKENERVKEVITSDFWNKIMYEKDSFIPADQLSFFEEYHDVYEADINSKSDGSGCAAMREEAINDLKSLLSRENTVLSTLGRVILSGVISVLFCLPILDFLSPSFVNLGEVKENSFFWGVGFFMLPVIYQFVRYFIYLRKRSKCIRVLKAYYTHDAYARLANRIEFEAEEFYNKMIKLLKQYLERCERIRREVNVSTPTVVKKPLIPETMFNQPLNGGRFDNEEIIPAKEIECSRIKVNYKPYYVNELRKPHYFLLINRFKDELSELFLDVEVQDSHMRRFNEAKGDYEFISQDEIKRNQEQLWKQHCDEFYRLLRKGIKEDMLPRSYPTVGEKLLQYMRKIDRFSMLRPLMAIAATNGEIVAESDTEYADVKVNCHIDDLSSPYLPLITTRIQVAKYTRIFEKYIFVTRWRCFEHFSYNRILPTEDFDVKEREKVNYVAHVKARELERREQQRRNNGGIDVEVRVEEKVMPYVACISSLLLWAVCPDDNSSEWLKLFIPEHFSQAYSDRDKYQEILNQND